MVIRLSENHINQLKCVATEQGITPAQLIRNYLSTYYYGDWKISYFAPGVLNIKYCIRITPELANSIKDCWHTIQNLPAATAVRSLIIHRLNQETTPQ